MSCTVLAGAIALPAASARADGYAGGMPGVSFTPAPEGEKIPAPADVLPAGLPVGDGPVDLVADRLEHDEARQIITASGDVELVQAGRILRADTVSYHLGTDTVRATGHVVLSEPTGDTYFADDIQLTDRMKDGFVQGLHGLLADGSRFTAKEGERVGGTKIILREASYTPCEPCKEDPSRPPVWQLVAEEVTHDKEEARIIYQNARFELGGVPVAWTPYFSHPDGSIKRKSGFLTPSVGFDSELGATYQQEYYWAIAPDRDATTGILVATEENPVAIGEYRQRFSNADIVMKGSATASERTDREAGQDRERSDEFRGHIFADGRWDMNDKWRSGLKVRAVTDEQYLRQYDFSNEDVLENELYTERFDDRDYAVARVMAFQDVRVSDRQTDQPAVLPEVTASFVGEPNAALGGRWNAEVSALGLHREGKDQDMSRGTVELGWQRRYVTGIGLVGTADLMARGDAYNTQDRDIASDASGRSRDTTQMRGFSRAHVQASWPVAKSFEKAQAVVEPIAAVTAGTNVNVDSDIPNEDSQDVFIDALKLLEPDRFPGYDRIEDRTHVTYGLRSGVYGYNGYRAAVFFGQSHRFDNDDNPFPEGSGLSGQESDYVGQISADFGSLLDLDYRFQLENTSFASQRHEVDATGTVGPLSLGTRYFYANSLEGTDFTESREQIRGSARLRLGDHWAVYGAAQYDFGEDDGLRKASYGVDYLGQCVNLSLIGQRTLTTDSSGDSGTELLLRIGLKNLGEFQTSGLSLGGSEE